MLRQNYGIIATKYVILIQTFTIWFLSHEITTLFINLNSFYRVCYLLRSIVRLLNVIASTIPINILIVWRASACFHVLILTSCAQFSCDFTPIIYEKRRKYSPRVSEYLLTMKQTLGVRFDAVSGTPLVRMHSSAISSEIGGLKLRWWRGKGVSPFISVA